MTGLVDDQGDMATPAKILLLVAAGFAIIMMGIIETFLKKRDDEPMHPVRSPLIKVISGLAILSLYFIVNAIVRVEYHDPGTNGIPDETIIISEIIYTDIETGQNFCCLFLRLIEF